MSLVKKLKPVAHSIPWAGPCGEGQNGGVTQSMLGRYLCCKERFRILVIEGLKPHPRFSAPMDFGTMWHSCEENLARGNVPTWLQGLEDCVNRMLVQYPRDVENILHWTSVAQELFPVYTDYWAEHPDVQNRKPLLAEQPFDVPYLLPSGRTVRLRGKWDSVDLVGSAERCPTCNSPDPKKHPAMQFEGEVQPCKNLWHNGSKTSSIWLQENKTKSGIDRAKIMRQLTFDLQTMVYLIALQHDDWACYESDGHYASDTPPHPIAGVRYNVIRRSAHKTAASMMKKVSEDIAAGRANEWFDRLNVTISAQDIKRFRVECLDPVLDNLCDDFEWWADAKKQGLSPFDNSAREPHHFPRHFRMPFGIYNPVTEGGFGDVDAYLEDGSEIGLQRVTNLFPELQEEP